MNRAFEGPESEVWVEPFAAFLIEQGCIEKLDCDRALRLWPTLDSRLGWLAATRRFMRASDVYTVLANSQDRDALFGEVAVELGVLKARQVAELLMLQRSPFRLFVHTLLTCGMLDQTTLSDQVDLFAETHGLASLVDSEGHALTRLGPDLIPDAPIRKAWVWRKLDALEPLAMIPQASIALLERLEADAASSAQLAELAAGDPSLAAQLLRVAHATRPSIELIRLDDAVSVLGERTVRQLVLMPSALCPFASSSAAQATTLWVHAQRCAAWCELLAERAQVVDPEEARLHGLLHNLGHFVLLQSFPSECEHVARLARQDATLEQAERQVFGTTHADIGAYVCRDWSLPESMSQAILHHATPTALIRELPELLPTTALVHAACKLAYASERGPCSQDALDPGFVEFHALATAPLLEMAQAVEAQLVLD